MNGMILVVDDDSDVLQLTRLILETSGFSVRTAHGGVEAIEQLKGTVPDLVILDVMMPGVNGWEVLDFLKNDDRTSNIPIILMTARDTPDEIRVGYEYGACFYLTKPWTKRQLRYAVGFALGFTELMSDTDGEGGEP